ncbi:MAG TPA: hypothetical protein PLI05_00265 [Methanotrichaceae archaeon]|nr:hypothetical protein [Methanotrichaceae archaeon]HQF15486.1 hypothetical protein [Methanotrichaceae archaeon]
MKPYMGLIVLFALLGTGLAQNVDIGDVEAFKQALEQDGFTVQQGGLGYFDFMKLYNMGVLPAAYGNNPATKYLVYLVPPASGHDVTGKISEIIQALGVTTKVTPFWSLRPDEAVVFVGRTPPECRYFSLDQFLMERTYGNETRWIFAPLCDTVNNLIIKTEGTPDGSLGNPYNQTTIAVSTADKGIDQRIRAAAQSAGYSDGIINTQVLPSAMLNMGVEDNNSDTFAVFIRGSLFADEQAGDDYIANKPAIVLRITPNESTELDLYDMPELRVRGTGTTEFDLMDDLEQLRMAILNKYSKLNATELPTSIALPDGADCVQRGIDGYGPTNDACYLWSVSQTASSATPPFPDLSQYYSYLRDSPITLGNDTNEFIIVYGVNHVATGKVTYENFVTYGADVWNGVGMITDLDFNGTAEAYLPDNPNAKYLYVYKIARNCSGDTNCFEVPYNAEGYGIDLDQPLFIAWRLYLEKATKTGPSYSEIVYDRAIKFDPKE